MTDAKAHNEIAWLAAYKVAWTSPSRDSLDSMPLSGRLGAGANVWVQDGALWLYLAHNGAHDEQGRLLKLGCLRIAPVAGAFAGADFYQELDPATGAISVRTHGIAALLWFAGETLLIEVMCERDQALDLAFGTWRDRPRTGLQLNGLQPEDMTADHVVADGQGFLWFHRNADYPVDLPAMARGQGIDAEAIRDVTTRRVSGGAAVVEAGLVGLSPADVRWQHWDGRAWTGRTPARARHVVAVALGAALDADPEAWRTRAAALLRPDALEAARADERERWAEFWSRSHIVVNPGAGSEDAGWLVGRNYQLFRYMLACNRGGELPLLFNGGIFTTDATPGRITGNNNDELPINPDGPTTPDHRRWMFCRFMSQNQRWLGWPTLACGDADLLWPSLVFYRDRATVAASRARTHGAEGVVYPESLDIWGLCAVAPRSDGLCGARHLTFHFSMMLEHAWMALQAHDALGIPLEQDLEWIEGTVWFYDAYYRARMRERTGNEFGDDGKYVLYPTCGLEFAEGATDALEVVAGLKRVTGSLLGLPKLSAGSRARLIEIERRLPELPAGEREGRRSLLPARTLEREYNFWEPIGMSTSSCTRRGRPWSKRRCVAGCWKGWRCSRKPGRRMYSSGSGSRRWQEKPFMAAPSVALPCGCRSGCWVWLWSHDRCKRRPSRTAQRSTVRSSSSVNGFLGSSFGPRIRNKNPTSYGAGLTS